MADLSKLSDAELINAYKQQAAPNDLAKLSDAELVKLYQQTTKQNSGILDTAKEYGSKALGAIRSGLETTQNIIPSLVESVPGGKSFMESGNKARTDVANTNIAMLMKAQPGITPEQAASQEQNIADISQQMGINVFPIAKVGSLAKGAVQKGMAGLMAPEQVAAKTEPQFAKPGIISETTKTGKSVIKEIIGGVKPSELSPKSPKMIEIAKKLGLGIEDLTDAQLFGRESDAGRSFKVLSEMPAGEPLRVQHSKVLGAAEKGMNQFADDLSKGRTIGIDNTETLGQQMIDDFKVAQDNIRNQIDFDRRAVYEQIGGKVPIPEKKLNTVLTSLEKIQNKTGRLASSAIDEKVGLQLGRVQQTIENAKNYVAKGDMKSFHEAIQDIGDIAFQQSNLTKEAKKILSETYFEMTGVYDASAKKYLGADIANRIDKSNSLWSEWYNSSDTFKNTLASEKDPEKIFKLIMNQGGSRHVDEYLNLMRTYNPEGFENARSIYTKNLINNAKNQTGYGFDGFLSNLKDPDKVWRTRKFLNPDEIKQLQEFAEFGAEAGGPINPSGTEVTRGWKEVITKPFQRGSMELRHKSLTSKRIGLSKPE